MREKLVTAAFLVIYSELVCGLAHHCWSHSVLEMNYDLADDTIHWPTLRHFSIVKTEERMTDKGWVVTKEFWSNEHVGTHIDAPIHFAKDRWTVDEIPFERLVDRPLAVVNISDKAEVDPDAQVEVEDLMIWEDLNGRFPEESIILMNSGWGKRFWGNKTAYFGTENIVNTSSHHFPGFHPNAAAWLQENRNIYGIGVDSASVDYGQNQGAPTHRLLSDKNIFILENVANVDQLPAGGALLTVMPIKIRGGTGGPARIFARIGLDNSVSMIRSEWSLYGLALCLLWIARLA